MLFEVLMFIRVVILQRFFLLHFPCKLNLRTKKYISPFNNTHILFTAFKKKNCNLFNKRFTIVKKPPFIAVPVKAFYLFFMRI